MAASYDIGFDNLWFDRDALTPENWFDDELDVAAAQAATVTPPTAVVVERDQQRRRVAESVVAPSGLLASSPGAAPPPGSPPQPYAVEQISRSRRVADSVVLNGTLAALAQPPATPPQPLTVEQPRRRVLAPDPLTARGYVDSGVGVPGTTPPLPVSVDRPERRRSAVETVAILSGLLASLADVLPENVNLNVVDRQDQRHRYRPLDAIIISGVLAATQAAPTVTPPESVSIDRVDRRPRAPEPFTAPSGLLASSPGATPSAGNPPAPTNVDRQDQRQRRTVDAVVLSGALAALLQPPPVTPPGPFVVSTEERRRFLAALQPTAQHGYDDVEPPEPQTIEPGTDRRRYRAPDPLALSGVLAAILGPIVAPPRSLVVVGEDGRLRRFPQPIVLHGPAFPSGVVEAIYTQQFGPGNPDAADLAGNPDGNKFPGGPDDGELVGVLAGNNLGGSPS